MILYHATTKTRAVQIFESRYIKCNIDRYYTEEDNGDGYSTQGFVYLSNEITFALYFANCHNINDKSDALYIFKFDIPDNIVEADYDELRIQMARKDEIKKYGGDLQCSLLEYKSCKVAVDLYFDHFQVSYYKIDLSSEKDIDELIGGVGCNFISTTENYTTEQRQFMQNIVWATVD